MSDETTPAAGVEQVTAAHLLRDRADALTTDTDGDES